MVRRHDQSLPTPLERITKKEDRLAFEFRRCLPVTETSIMRTMNHRIVGFRSGSEQITVGEGSDKGGDTRPEAFEGRG